MFGLVISILIVSIGSRTWNLDAGFLKTFPDIDAVFPNTRFDFPDRLENTDPDRVGAKPDEEIAGTPTTTSEEQTDMPSVSTSSDQSTPISSTNQQETENVTGYVLQAGAFGERRHAEAFRASLLLEGYNAYTTEHPDENTVAPFRVIIGPYDSEEESTEDIARLRQRNVSAFLVPMQETSP